MSPTIVFYSFWLALLPAPVLASVLASGLASVLAQAPPLIEIQIREPPAVTVQRPSPGPDSRSRRLGTAADEDLHLTVPAGVTGRVGRFRERSRVIGIGPRGRVRLAPEWLGLDLALTPRRAGQGIDLEIRAWRRDPDGRQLALDRRWLRLVPGRWQRAEIAGKPLLIRAFASTPMGDGD